MKKIVSALVGLSLSLFAVSTQAHEGHDHVPGSVKAPHGGSVQVGKNLALELLQDGESIKIYPITHEGKLIALKDVTIKSAQAKTRKMKAAEKISLESLNDFYVAKFDPKSEHRFELLIETSYQGKIDSLKFQIEPRE